MDPNNSVIKKLWCCFLTEHSKEVNMLQFFLVCAIVVSYVAFCFVIICSLSLLFFVHQKVCAPWLWYFLGMFTYFIPTSIFGFLTSNLSIRTADFLLLTSAFYIHTFNFQLLIFTLQFLSFYFQLTTFMFMTSHYENMPILIYWKFYHQKMKIFR